MQVFGLLRVKGPDGGIAELVDLKNRAQQLAGQRGGQLFGIVVADLIAHLVMHAAQRVGAGFAVRLAGEGSPQDGL